MPNDKLKSFYEAIKSNPSVKGLPSDYSAFEKAMSNEETSKKFYDAISQNPNIKGLPADYDQFSGALDLKKKEPSVPMLQSGSEKQPTSSTSKERVSPLKSIDRGVNPSNQPVMVGGQAKPAPKKEIPSIDFVQEEQPSDATRVAVQAPKEAKVPVTKEGAEKIFTETQKQFGKEFVADEYEEAQKDFADESKFIQRLEAGDLELQEKYFPEGLSQNIKVRREQIKTLIAEHKERYAQKEQRANKSQFALNDQVSKAVEEKLSGENYKQYLTDSAMGVETIDQEKVQALSDELASEYGYTDESYIRRFIKNKVESEVDFKSIEKDVDKEFSTLVKPLSDEEYSELVKKAAIGDKEAQVLLSYQSKKRALDKGFTVPEKEEIKLELASKTLSAELDGMLQQEVKPIQESFKAVSDELNGYLKQREAEVSGQLNNLKGLYENGQISYEQYKAQFDATKAQFDNEFTAKQEESAKAYDEYVKAINSVNAKYEKRYAREMTELVNAAKQRVSESSKQYYDSKEARALNQSLENVYAIAAGRVVQEKEESNKRVIDSVANALPFGGSTLLFANAIASSVGGAMYGMGAILENETIEDFGKRMESRFKTYAPKSSEFSDLTDMNNLATLSGNVIGSMIPSLTAAAVTTAVTEGAGVGAAGQMVANAIAVWGAETADVTGRTYADTFSRTGSVAEAEKAAQLSMDSQIDLIWTYALTGLPFVKNSLDFVPTQLGRVAVGASMEYGEEFIQEFHQNIAQENIDQGQDSPWANYINKITDTERLKETAISIAPVALIGGVGQVGSKSKAQVLSDAFIANKTKNQLNEVLGDQKNQYFRDLTFSEGVKTAKAVVASLYTSGQISEQEMAELTAVVDESETFEKTAKQNGLSFNDRDIYAFYSSRANEAERRSTETDDPVMSKVYADQAKDYRNAAVNFLNGNEADFFSIKYKDGSQFLFTPQDAKDAFKSKELRDAVKNNKVEIAAFGKKAGELLVGLNEELKAETPARAILDRMKTGAAERGKVKVAAEKNEVNEEKQKERDELAPKLREERAKKGVEVNLFEDVPIVVTATLDRVENNDAVDRTAIDITMEYLYGKYNELEAMKSDPNRMYSRAEISEMQANLQKDAETVSSYTNEVTLSQNTTEARDKVVESSITTPIPFKAVEEVKVEEPVIDAVTEPVNENIEVTVTPVQAEETVIEPTEPTATEPVVEEPKLEGKEAAKAKVDAVAEKLKAALKVKGIERIDVKKQGIGSDEIIDLAAQGVKAMIDAGYAVKDAIDYVLDSIKDDIEEGELDRVKERVSLKANEDLINQAREAGKSQKSTKGKKEAMERALESKGNDAKKAIFVELNFEAIANELLDSKVITRKC